MANDIHAFVQNADDFDTIISSDVKNHVPTFRIAHVAFLYIVAAFPERRVLC